MNRILAIGKKVGPIGGMLLMGAYNRPGIGVVQNRLDELGVEMMTRAFADNMADNVDAEERQVSDEIQHLMANAFVRETECLFIQNAGLRKHDGVVQRTAFSQTASP